MKDIEYVIIKIEGNQLFLNDNNSVLAKNAIKIDDFILPEEWCIKVTNENKNKLLTFINSKVKTRREFLEVNHTIYIGKMLTQKGSVLIENNYFCHINSFGIKEITFEQFKKYVLNETV
jgi:hypothetical protein